MHELMSRFSIIHRQSSIALDRKLKAEQISASQYTHILVICENPGVSQEEISRLLRIDKGSVARTIQQFERKGYVTRIVSAQDKRQYQLFPTEKATDLYRRIRNVAVQSEEALTRGLTTAQRETLIALLDRVIENLET